jgi:hypothetical protein
VRNVIFWHVVDAELRFPVRGHLPRSKSSIGRILNQSGTTLIQDSAWSVPQRWISRSRGCGPPTQRQVQYPLPTGQASPPSLLPRPCMPII